MADKQNHFTYTDNTSDNNDKIMENLHKQTEPYIGHKLVSCIFKKSFATLKEVQEHCKTVNLYYYKCRYCGNYHTTRQITYETIME